MRRARLPTLMCIAVAACAALRPGGAAAQAPPAPGAADPADYAGQPVAGVTLRRGDVEVTDPRWLALLETPAGQPLSLREVRETLLHLFHTGLFDTVEVSATRAGSGVHLEYLVVPSRTVTRYSFTGETGLPVADLRQAVLARFGDRLAPARAAAAAEVLAQHLRDRGFPAAAVTPTVEPEAAEDRAVLRFAVAAGPRARLARVQVTGHPVEPPARVLDALGLSAGEVHDRLAIDRRLSELTRDLRRRGYYEATALARARPRSPGVDVDLDIEIEPGRLVTLRFEGDPIPESRRDELVPVEREASVDEDLLEDSKRRVERYLKEQGHWTAQATYRREFTEGRLEVVFSVRAGPIYRVDRVRIDGVEALPRTEVESILELKPGDLFVESVADARTAAVVERYRRAGFRLVRIDQVVEPREPAASGRGPAAAGVDLRLSVVEGPRALVGAVQVTGNRAVPDREFRGRLQLQPGTPFYEPLLTADRETIALAYLDRGFDRARIDASTAPAAGGGVDVTFAISEGEQVRVDRVLIVGNRRTSAATIERALALEPGEPLGLAALFESQRRLRALGLFRRVSITDVGEPGEASRDLLVLVEEAAPTTIGYGGGIEAGRYLRQDQPGGQASERIELAGRGFFEIGRQNLWGSNRSVNLFTRLSLRPSGAPEAAGRNDFGFNEYRVLLSFRDPGLFGTAADARVTGYFEQAVRSSFNFVRRGVLAETARRVGGRVNLAGSYSLSEVRLFDERIAPQDWPDIDRLFPQLRLSKFSAALRRDARDDVLDPTTGTLVGGEADVSGRAMGSQVGFVKGFGEVFAYRRLPGSRRVVLAAGARVGLARGFQRAAVRLSEEGTSVFGPDGQPVEDVVSDLPASERFFAGGDTTVRGFARDGLGSTGTIDPNGFPTGGHALIVLNAELRAPIWRDLGGVVFLDAGNVFRRVSDVDLGALRAAAGLGMRYKSPLGPVRVDVGFKLDDRLPVAGRREPGYTLHFSIGQAF